MSHSIRFFSKFVPVCSVCFLLTGCLSSVGSIADSLFKRKATDALADSTGGTGDLAPVGPKIKLKEVSISADKGANEDSAIRFHLVFVFDRKVLTEFMRISSKEYFSKVDQYARDYPGMFHVNSWELIPGQSVANQKVDAGGGKPMSVILFADYVTKGLHRQRIGSDKKIRIFLRKSTFQYLGEE